MTLDVFYHDDRVIDDKTDGEYDREQSKEVHGEPENLHQEDRADERDRNGDDGNNDGAPRTEEQKDDEHHDHQRLDEGLEDVLDGGVNVGRAVVGDAAFHAGGQFPLDLFHLDTHA